MYIGRITVFLLALALTISSLGVPQALKNAYAAPPTNDDFDAATVIGTLPFNDVLDTSEATTAADDPDCGGNGSTVWYAFTPSGDTGVMANTFGSDYDTTLSVYTGPRGSLTQLACNDDFDSLQSKVTFNAAAGETYFFMVGAFESDPGGNLVFSVDIAPPSLIIDLTIDRIGLVNPRTGVATISGTVTCSREAHAGVFVDLQQKLGRSLGSGSSIESFTCDGQTRWSAIVSSENILFVGGRAHVSASAFAFDPSTGEFVFDDAVADIKLRGSR